MISRFGYDDLEV